MNCNGLWTCNVRRRKEKLDFLKNSIRLYDVVLLQETHLSNNISEQIFAHEFCDYDIFFNSHSQGRMGTLIMIKKKVSASISIRRIGNLLRGGTMGLHLRCGVKFLNIFCIYFLNSDAHGVVDNFCGLKSALDRFSLNCVLMGDFNFVERASDRFILDRNSGRRLNFGRIMKTLVQEWRREISGPFRFYEIFQPAYTFLAGNRRCTSRIDRVYVNFDPSFSILFRASAFVYPASAAVSKKSISDHQPLGLKIQSKIHPTSKNGRLQSWVLNKPEFSDLVCETYLQRIQGRDDPWVKLQSLQTIFSEVYGILRKTKSAQTNRPLDLHSKVNIFRACLIEIRSRTPDLARIHSFIQAVCNLRAIFSYHIDLEAKKRSVLINSDKLSAF